MLSNKNINTRKPVWSALSELWLDTELEEIDLDRIAEIMFQSGYSIEELHKIYQTELAPIVYFNLLSPAGEWAGFDDIWLHQKIIASLKSRNSFDRLLLKLKRKLMFYATDKHWKALEMRVVKMKYKITNQKK